MNVWVYVCMGVWVYGCMCEWVYVVGGCLLEPECGERGRQRVGHRKVTVRYRYMCVSMYLSIYLTIYLCICVSIYLSIYVYVYLSIHLSIYLSMYMCVFVERQREAGWDTGDTERTQEGIGRYRKVQVIGIGIGLP
jgi:hypothetical protein